MDPRTIVIRRARLLEGLRLLALCSPKTLTAMANEMRERYERLQGDESAAAGAASVLLTELAAMGTRDALTVIGPLPGPFKSDAEPPGESS